MSSKVEFWGDTFDEHTDWRALVARPYFGRGWEARWADAASALGQLAEALRGTAMEIALADAALEKIETGTEEEMRVVESAGWEKAPKAFERILALLERRPRTLPDFWIGRLYGALFRERPKDVRMLALFGRDVREPNRSSLLEYAARYNVDWLTETLPSVRPAPSDTMWIWLAVAGMGDGGVPPSKVSLLSANRVRVLGAIAKLGPTHVQSLIEQVLSLPPNSVREPLLDTLAAHPEFAGHVPAGVRSTDVNGTK